MEGKPLKGQKKVVHNIGRFDELDLFFASIDQIADFCYIDSYKLI